jgi:hypothetical protein
MPLGADLAVVPVAISCAALSWAGLEKARNRAPLSAAVAALGIPGALTTVIAVAVPLAELGTVAAVVAGAPSRLVAALIAGLGAGFAVAAGWSMLTGRDVGCACFGSSGRKLGWPQLAALPLWLLAAWAAARMPHASGQERVAALACGAVALAIIRSVPAMRRGIDARDDRRAVAGV